MKLTVAFGARSLSARYVAERTNWDVIELSTWATEANRADRPEVWSVSILLVQSRTW